MKGRTHQPTAAHARRDQENRQFNQDQGRGVKRVVGIIETVDPNNNNGLEVTVRVPLRDGGSRLFANGTSTVTVIDSPMDILLKYGKVRPGMGIEVFYTGIAENGQATGRIITDSVETLRQINKQEPAELNVAATLPFEPFGI